MSMKISLEIIIRIKENVTPQILKEWLGHESIVTTMDTYYNNQQDTIDKAIEIMNN